MTQSILSYDNTKNSYGSVHRAVVPLTTAGLKRLMFDDEGLRTAGLKRLMFYDEGLRTCLLGLRTNWQRLKPRWRRK